MQPPRFKAGGRAFAHIAQYHPELTALRRDLHAHPELGFEEVYTAARVREALRACGVDEVHEGIGRTGVVGVIHGQGRGSGAMIGLRADMDALPMAEHNDFAWKSCKSGLMHGCGHDGHTAMLVGAARYLAATRHFDGTAVLIFQPGEEGLGGARVMIEDGLFERFPVQSVYAMHNWPAMKPGTATLVGTVRAFDPSVQDMVERRIQELCNAVALGFGATANVRYERIYPATINTEAEARFAGDVAEALVGAENLVRDLEPSMGAEDFSFMLQAKPGAYLRLGQGMGAGNSTLHNSRYDFNDDILPLGAALHAGLVEQAMPLAAAQ
jgi:metal-dependent amidase/aminoacylase/carboxypeptidase family protein